MMIGNEFYLLKLVPQVLRARDFRLYTRGSGAAANGGRIVDLWQNGGAAILGHTPPAFLRELKNSASRGLYAPFPHFLEDRYKKALSRIFPERVFTLYAAPPPQLEKFIVEGKAALWRPFVDLNNPLAVCEKAPPVLIPVLPGISGWRGELPLGLCILAIDPKFEKELALPPYDYLPPVLLAAAARGLYDLIAFAVQRAKPQYQRIFKTLKNNDCQWQRSGLYLNPKSETTDEEWEQKFKHFLEAGFLLPPVKEHPVILPGILSHGEEAKLAGLLAYMAEQPSFPNP